MKIKTTLVTALTLVGALAISGSVLADQQRGKGMRGGGEGMIKRLTHQLDMEKEQRDKVWAVYDDIHPKLRSLGEQSRDNRKALAEAIRNNASKRDIDKLAKKQGDLKAKMISLRADMQRDIRSQLTDEQRAKIDEMREQRKMRSKHHRRGRGKGRKQQPDGGAV